MRNPGLPAVITGINVNYVFQDCWWRLRGEGVEEDSRNGKVLVMPGPVITTFLRPEQRVLFNPKRNANPVFHLVEAIWMFAGRKDVASLLPFNSKYELYAEPDGDVHGAYGFRWRNHFGPDQIRTVVDELRVNPNSRQAVMAMWDPAVDLPANVRDRPCNTHVYFDCRGGALNMTVCCRSNDVLWGAYGANVVHFSMLQELIARCVGVEVGVYRQMSNNYHVYMDQPQVKDFLENPPFESHDDYHGVEQAHVFPMLRGCETLDDFLHASEQMFVDGGDTSRSAFIHTIVEPLATAYITRKQGLEDWRADMKPCPKSCDWKIAFDQWAFRADSKLLEKDDIPF